MPMMLRLWGLRCMCTIYWWWVLAIVIVVGRRTLTGVSMVERKKERKMVTTPVKVHGGYHSICVWAGHRYDEVCELREIVFTEV